MENNGFIKLHRSMTEWEWYDDIPTKVLFLHILFLVNWEDKKWRGEVVKRGEIITSVIHLAETTTLSIKQVRRALKNLQTTGEIEVKTTNRYTKIKIKNYSKYQDNTSLKGKQKTSQNSDKHYKIEETQNDEGKQRANKGQTKGKQRATTKEYKEDKELKNNNTIYINNNNKSNILIKEKDKEKLKEKEREKEKVTKRGKDIPPSVDDVRAYCEERNNGIDAEYFCDFYQSKNWFVGKNKMKDWKACVRTWERNRKSKNLVGDNGIELKPESERNHKLDKIFKRS